jgi:hypothetical protein
MRNHTCANRRSVVAASDETPVSHVTPPAPLARVRTSRREAPHAPLRPAWPVSRRATLWHALAYLSALAARQAPRAAPRAAQRSMKPAAVLNVAIEHGKQLATRALEPRRAPPIELRASTGRKNVMRIRAAARQGDLLHHGNAGGAGICDQACGLPNRPR